MRVAHRAELADTSIFPSWSSSWANRVLVQPNTTRFVKKTTSMSSAAWRSTDLDRAAPSARAIAERQSRIIYCNDRVISCNDRDKSLSFGHDDQIAPLAIADCQHPRQQYKRAPPNLARREDAGLRCAAVLRRVGAANTPTRVIGTPWNHDYRYDFPASTSTVICTSAPFRKNRHARSARQ